MKKIIALAVIVAIVSVGYGGAWLWAAGQAGAYVKTLETADGVTTPRVFCGDFGVGGFPFGFDISCANARIEMNDVTVETPSVKLAIEVYRPTHVLAFVQSPLNVADAFTGSQSRIDFDSLEASVRLNGWRLGRLSAVAELPIWTDTVLGDRQLAHANRAEFHLLDMPDRHDAAAGVASLAQYAKVEGLNAPGFEIVNGEAVLESEISNLPDDVRVWGEGDVLRRWQAAGGRLLLTGFNGHHGDSTFSVSGTLGLDDAGRAEGQLKLASKGIVERLGDLIPEQMRGLVVGTQEADGSYTQTVNINSGVIFSGLMPAGLVPPLF